MKKNNKSNDPLRDNPIVYIWVTFWYDQRTYKEFRMVASHSVLSETCEACEEALKNDSSYFDTVYNETINMAFRPRVFIQDICNSVIRYICCSINVKDLLTKYPQTGVEIFSHINVDDDELSQVDVLDPEIFGKIGKIDPEFSLVDNSELSMTLPSKLDFLSEIEFKFLDGLFQKISNSDKNMVILNFGQLWDLIDEGDSNETDTITRDEMDQTLNNLSFYDLIAVDMDYLEKHHSFKLSINNLQIYCGFLQQNDIRMPA